MWLWPPAEGDCSRNKRCPEEEKYPKILVLTRDSCLRGSWWSGFVWRCSCHFSAQRSSSWGNSQMASSSWPGGSLISLCRAPSDGVGSHRCGIGKPLRSCHKVLSGVGAREWIKLVLYPKKELVGTWAKMKLEYQVGWSSGIKLGLPTHWIEPSVWQGLELDGLLGPFRAKPLHDCTILSSPALGEFSLILEKPTAGIMKLFLFQTPRSLSDGRHLQVSNLVIWKIQGEIV